MFSSIGADANIVVLIVWMLICLITTSCQKQKNIFIDASKLWMGKNTVNICKCSRCYVYCGDSLCYVEALFRNIYYKFYFHLHNNGCRRMTRLSCSSPVPNIASKKKKVSLVGYISAPQLVKKTPNKNN